MLEPGHVLDLYDDAHGLYIRDGKILEKYGAKLMIERESDLASLPDREFALVLVTKTGELHRKFPVHTPDQLAISTHYFENTGATLPDEARKIAASNLVAAYARYGAIVPDGLAKAAAAGVESPYFSLGRYHAEAPAPAAEPAYAEKYAFARDLADGSKVEMFPVDTPELLAKSVAEFKKVAFELDGGDRWRTARALADLVAAQGTKDEVLEKMGSLDPNPAFMSYIAGRMPYLTEENQQTLSTLSKVAGALPGVKVAQALEAFDLKAGISHLWDIRIQNPWTSCFQQKTASVKVGDREVTARDVIRLVDSGKLDSMFKKATLAEIRKQPLEVYASLPDPLKREIANLL